MLRRMADRAFPVVFATRVVATVAFYEHLGFRAFFQLPPDGEPGYVGLRRGAAELAVVDAAWPADQYAQPFGTGARFEMFVYVDDVDAMVGRLGGRAVVLREPADMPWGERVAYVADPDGNPVALAQAAPASS
jgi:lactoylglutathione lyase